METLELQDTETEWMDLKTAAKYLNVSYKTLMTFRSMGLEIAEIGRLRRVSKSALNEFMKQHSF